MVIALRVYGNSVDYILTKKIHHYQIAILEEDDYTDFEFLVIDNYEFRSKILALGSNAEVLEPSELRKSFAKITEQMKEMYLEYDDEQPCKLNFNNSICMVNLQK